MSTRFRIALAIYWANALGCLAVGLAFVTSDSFFPFHGDVVGLAWEQVEPSAQKLYLGMMRTEGAGYLATAIAMAFLLLFPLRTRPQGWAVWAITTIALVEHLPTFLATYHVAQTTAASPPWPIVLGCMVSLLVAAFLARSASSKKANFAI